MHLLPQAENRLLKKKRGKKEKKSKKKVTKKALMKLTFIKSPEYDIKRSQIS